MGNLFSGIGTALGGLFGYKGAKDRNVASAQQAQQQMAFQREMSNTAVQRRMEDLKKAGINPILAGSKEASSPAGAQAPQFNKAEAALQQASSAASIASLMAQTDLTNAKTKVLDPASEVGNFFGDVLEDLGLSSAFDTLRQSSKELGSAIQKDLNIGTKWVPILVQKNILNIGINYDN